MLSIIRHISLGICLLSLANCTVLIPVNEGYRSNAVAEMDTKIAQDVQTNLFKLDARFQFSRVNITSYFGAVLLTGQVVDPYLKQLATDSIKIMPNVKIVHNYITVGDKLGFNQIVQDGMITANIKNNITSNIPSIKQDRLSISTENSIVYVMGQLTQAEINSTVALLQQTPNVNKITMLVDTLATPEKPSASLPLSSNLKAPTYIPSSSSLDVGSLQNSAWLAVPSQQTKPFSSVVSPVVNTSESSLEVQDGHGMPYMPEIKPLQDNKEKP